MFVSVEGFGIDAEDIIPSIVSAIETAPSAVLGVKVSDVADAPVTGE